MAGTTLSTRHRCLAALAAAGTCAVIPMTCSVDRDGRPGLCIPGEMAEADLIGLAGLALPEAR